MIIGNRSEKRLILIMTINKVIFKTKRDNPNCDS